MIANKSKGIMSLLYISLTGAVMATMKTKNLILFYIFFEARVVPITLIVFIYGYQPEKLQASLFLLIYTVVGRLPLLFILIVYGPLLPGCLITQVLASISATLGFMIKTPIFLLHT